jgi:ABC-2 type transport system ATP-binding protein
MAGELARRLDLDLQRRVAFMSTGMRQKLALCCVMSCPSPLMILDEPTANLDPTVRNIVLELVREAASRGASVIFCSHVLSEIEEICDDVAILRKGQVVYQGRVAEIRQIHRLRARANGGLREDAIPQGARLIESLEGRIVLDLPGTLDHYLDWMARMGLADVQVEMVGLRSLYESHHAQVP